MGLAAFTACRGASLTTTACVPPRWQKLSAGNAAYLTHSISSPGLEVTVAVPIVQFDEGPGPLGTPMNQPTSCIITFDERGAPAEVCLFLGNTGGPDGEYIREPHQEFT